MLTTLSYSVFCERIRRRLANGWPNIKFNLTDNEILLYLYESAATVATYMSNNNYSMDGVRSIPEGFITTYKFTGNQITQDKDSGIYEIKLPAPPINLRLGYSISDPYFAAGGQRSFPLIAVNPFQRGFYDKLVTPGYGVFYWVEGSTLKMDSAGQDLPNSGITLYVPMVSPRSATGGMDDTINMPDDAMSQVFDMVIQKLAPRLDTPRDKVNDGNMERTQQP